MALHTWGTPDSLLDYSAREMIRDRTADFRMDQYMQSPNLGSFEHMELRWRGWSATINSLRSAGWMVESEKDLRSFRDRVAMTLPGEKRYVRRAFTPSYEMYPGKMWDIEEKLEVEESDPIRLIFSYESDLVRKNGSWGPPMKVDLEQAIRERWKRADSPTPSLILPKETPGDLLKRIVDMQQEDRIQRIKEKLKQEPQNFLGRSILEV